MEDEVPIAHDQWHSPAFATVSTALNTLAIFSPLSMAICDAAWMTGPSMTGSNTAADFDRVHAVFDHGAESFERIIRIRESVWQISDECRLVGGFEFIEHGFRRAWLVADAEWLAGRRG